MCDNTTTITAASWKCPVCSHHRRRQPMTYVGLERSSYSIQYLITLSTCKGVVGVKKIGSGIKPKFDSEYNGICYVCNSGQLIFPQSSLLHVSKPIKNDKWQLWRWIHTTSKFNFCDIYLKIETVRGLCCVNSIYRCLNMQQSQLWWAKLTCRHWNAVENTETFKRFHQQINKTKLTGRESLSPTYSAVCI